MPIAGDVITAAARRAAGTTIDRVFERAAARAAAAGPERLAAHARGPFELVELSPGQLDRFSERFARAAVWVDEGNCFNRAMLGAHLLDGQLQLAAGPLDDSFAGAIAVSRHRHLGGGYDGGFHAALAVRLRGETQLQVLDLLPGNPPLQALSRWSPDPDPLVLRPWAGTGLWNGVSHRSEWVGEGYFAFARDQLRATWDDAERHGLQLAAAGT